MSLDHGEFSGAPINILIVDDESRNLTVLETILDDPDYRLVRASSADQALLALIVEEFALLILDIRMPGMTGFELANMIKTRKKTARVPIIFLTAYYNEDQHVLEGYGAGAVDYLHKPVNPTVLRSKVAVFAELHRKNRECSSANRALLSEVTERRRAEDRLQELNETLELRVTERTQVLTATTAALELAKLSAEKANLAKSEFLSSMSHELRTPLHAIIGYTQLIEGLPLSPEQKTHLKQVLKAGWHLLELITGILDFSQIESGKLPLSLEPTSLRAILLECLAMIAPQAQKRGASVTVLPYDQSTFVQADPLRLRQVLLNLLSNAVKYGGEDVSVAASTVSPERIRISVKDCGPGLSADKVDMLFQPFNRAGQQFGTEEGAGIGLALCKRLVEAMGGNIGLDSTVGIGSIFWFELCVASAEKDRALPMSESGVDELEESKAVQARGKDG